MNYKNSFNQKYASIIMGCYITHNTNGSIVQLNSIIPNSMGLRTIFKYPMTLRYEDIKFKILKGKVVGTFRSL